MLIPWPPSTEFDVVHSSFLALPSPLGSVPIVNVTSVGIIRKRSLHCSFAIVTITTVFLVLIAEH